MAENAGGGTGEGSPPSAGAVGRATRRLSAVKWGLAGRIVWAWVLTIPMSALVAALFWYALRLIGRA